MKTNMTAPGAALPSPLQLRVRSMGHIGGLDRHQAMWVTRWIEGASDIPQTLSPVGSASVGTAVKESSKLDHPGSRTTLSVPDLRKAPADDLIATFIKNSAVDGGTLSSYRSGARKLVKWLRRRHLKPQELTFALLLNFRTLESSGEITGYQTAGANAFFRFLARNRCLAEFLLPPPTKADQLLNDYRRYLEVERGLAPLTVVRLCSSAAHSIPELFGLNLQKLRGLNGREVHNYVSARLTSSRGRYRTSNLSPLLRFLFTSGQIRSDLRGFLPKISRAQPVPNVLSEGERDRVLAASRGTSKKDVRNYAIVVLLNDLGLRAGEIRSLTKDAINWNALTIKVIRKGGDEDCLPLTKRAAKALAAYLKASTANNPTPYVFARLKGRCGPFNSSSGISVIITRLLRKCGLKHCRSAAHLFRHSFATDMLSRGAPINQIGGLLGHKGADTTRIYTRVSVPLLRTVTVPWVGSKHPLL